MQMRQKGMWLPLMASVGIGAAAYYSMTKNGRSMGKTMQQMVPFVSSMSMGGSQTQTQPQPQQQLGQQAQNQMGNQQSPEWSIQQ
ncbi:MAG TPA: hypothetical protein VFT51_05130 [Bacillales bacterium]|nr:hypothetical protein [Bacillales bacterium]